MTDETKKLEKIINNLVSKDSTRSQLKNAGIGYVSDDGLLYAQAILMAQNSDHNTHLILLKACSDVGRDKEKTSESLAGVREMLGITMAIGQNLRREAIPLWLEKYGMFNVERDRDTKRPTGKITRKSRVEYNKGWMDRVRGTPWYDMAADELKVFKIPAVSTKQLARVIEKNMAATGEELTDEEILAMIKKDRKEVKKEKGYKQFIIDGKKNAAAGKLSREDAPMFFDEPATDLVIVGQTSNNNQVMESAVH